MNLTGLLKAGFKLTALSTFFFVHLAFALPQGGSIAQGSAVISNPTSTQTVINQASQNAVINWSSFNTANGESVQFNQPNASAIALNRINSGSPTTFAGSLSANGQVWIINPNGILFTSTSTVNVAGLLATTSDISNANFMAGNYQFNAPAVINSSVINNGSITIENSGVAALVAPGVQNNGIITANLGKVYLASGSSYVVDLYGDNLINFGISAPIQNGYVSNSGTITATGGRVSLTANSAAQVVNNVVSMSGVIEATTASTGQHGEIILNGGNSGTVDVSGRLNASNGGHIETSGNVLVIEPTAVIDAGEGGSWLIDPANINITTSSPSTGITPNNLNPDTFTPNSGIATSNLLNTDITSQLNAGTSVIITTTNSGTDGGQLGIITVSAPVLWTTTASLTLDAANNIAINAGMGGTNAVLVLNAGALITQTAGITANSLTTSSVTGTGLTSGNAVSNFNATNTTSGNIAFADNIASLTVTGISEQTGGTLAISNSGAILFDPTVITGNTTLASNTGTVTFASTIDDATAHTDTLTISTATDPIFSGAIGGTTPLNTLAITEPSITIGSTLASIAVSQLNEGTNMTFTSTTGDVTLSSPITQTVNTNAVTLTLHSAANINLNSTISMIGSTLILEQPTITFNSALDTFVEGQLSAGTSVELDATTSPITIAIPVSATSTGSFIVVAPAGINLGANVSTGGSQTYSSPVTLTAEMNAPGLTSTSGNITFGSTVNGAFDLVATAASGTVTFDGAVGGATPLSSLNVPDASEIVSSITTAGDQNYFGNMIISSGALTSNSGNITFGTSGSPITIDALSPTVTAFIATATSGSVTVNGNIGTIGQLGTVTITAPDGIFLNSNTISVHTAQTYVGPVTLENNLLIEAQSPQFTFTSSVVAPAGQTLTLGTTPTAAAIAENVLFEGPVGQTLGGVAEPLGSFTAILGHLNALTFDSTLDVSGAVDIETNQDGTPGIMKFEGAVGSQTPPTSFVAILGNNVTADAMQQIIINSSLVVNGPITVQDNAGNAHDIGSTVTFNGAIGTSAIPATSLLVGAPLTGSIDIDSGVSSPIYVSGTETYQGPVLINNNPAVQFNGTSVTFNNTLDSPITPSVVTVPGNLILSAGGSIGQTNPLSSLLVDGTSSIGGNITTVNNQTYTGNTTLNAANITLISNGGGNISFGTNSNPATVNGADALNINTGFPSSSSTFWGTVGNTAALTSLTTTGTTNINGGSIKTTGAQNYNNAVILGATTVLTSTAGGALNFNTIDSNGTPQSLTLTTSALVTLNNNVGINSELNALTVTNGVDIGGNIHTVNNQLYSGTVTLIANSATPSLTTLTSDSGNITFASTLNGGFNLATSAASGAVTFDGAVGAATPLSSLAVTGTADINSNITTAGAQNYFGNIINNSIILTSNSGNITFGTSGNPILISPFDVAGSSLTVTATSGSVTLNGNIGTSGEINILAITAPQGIFLNSNTINTAATQTYTGPVTIENNLLMEGQAPGFLFTSSVVATANHTLELTYTGASTGQYAIFDGPVGQTLGGVAEPLGSLTIALYRVSNITFASTLDVSGAVSISGTQDDTAGTMTFDGAIGSQTPPTSFSAIFGDIVNTPSTQHIIFNSSLVVNGPITVEDSQGTHPLATTVDFNGAIGTSAIPATSLLVSVSLDGHIDINSGVSSPIYVSGTEDYIGPVLINNNPAMQFNGTSVTFNNTLDSPTTPSVVTIPGNLILAVGGSIGQTNPLNSLLVDGTSSIGGNITTVNNQTYTGAYTLTAANDDTSNNGSILFSNTVNGAFALTTNSTSGTTTFGGAVGGGTALTSLTTNGTTHINGGAVTTTGAQNYNNAVILGANTILTSTAGGALNFASIDSNGTPQSLTLTTSALTTLGNNVGINSELNALTVTNSVDIGGNIHTVHNQLYSGAATLIANPATPSLTTLTSDSGNITFNSTLDGAFNLATSAASGTVFFDNIVGGSTPLSSLAVTGAAVIGTNDTSITTTGTQVFNGSVTLTTPATEIFTGSSVTFNGAVSGTSTAIDIGPTNLSAITNLIVGTSGSITAKSLFVSGTTLGPNVTTTNGQIYTGAVTLNTNETYTDTSGSGFGINFYSTVDGDFNLIINENGASSVTFDGNVGGTTPLASLVVNGLLNVSGATVINTNNYQTYNNLVTLNNNIVLSAGTSGCTTTNCVEFTLGTIGVNGITGPTFNLSIFTYDSSKGSTGAGIAGTVDVGNFTMGGTGGGNVSPLTPDFSTVSGSSGVVAWNNTKIDPAATGLYCVNGFCISGSRILTITSSNDSKTYGQVFTPTLYMTSGLAPGDSITSLTLTSTGDPATAPVSGSPYPIDVSNASGPGLANHYTSITYDSTGLLTVNPATLTITADNANKNYGTTATFSPTAFTETGLVNSDTVSSVVESSAGAPASAAVGTYSIVPSNAAGSGLSNYTIIYDNGTLSVNTATLTITADNANKIYGTTATFAPTAFTETGLMGSDSISSVTENSTGAPATASVGNYTIVPSNAVGSGLSNYTIVYDNGTLMVNPATLTITADNANKIYGTTATFAPTAFTSTGLVNSDSISSVTESSTGAPATASVGNYNIVPSNAMGSGLTNYTIVYDNGTLMVNPAALTITADNASKTYGQTETFTGAPSQFTTNGLVNSDTVTSVTLNSTGSPATAPVSGSPYSIVPSAAVGTGLGNYTITYVNGSLTVNPAPLTITGNDVTKTYGQTVTFTGVPSEFTAVGLVNSDTVTDVTLNSTGAPATAPVSGSPYAIIPSSAVGTGLSNYAITYSPLGIITVNPAPLTITSLSQTKNVGTTLPSTTTFFTTTPLQNGETINTVDITSGGLPASAPVGTYTITGISNPTGSFNPANYTITYDPTGDIFVIAVNTIIFPTNVPPTEIFLPPEGPGCGIAGCDNTTIIVFDPIGGLGFPPDIIVYPAGNSGITGVVSGICGNLPIAVDEAGVPRQLHIGSVVYKKDTVIADQHSCTCIKTNSHETKCTHDTKHNPQWTGHCETCQANHLDNNHHVKSSFVPADTMHPYSLMNVLAEMKNKIAE